MSPNILNIFLCIRDEGTINITLKSTSGEWKKNGAEYTQKYILNDDGDADTDNDDNNNNNNSNIQHIIGTQLKIWTTHMNGT